MIKQKQMVWKVTRIVYSVGIRAVVRPTEQESCQFTTNNARDVAFVMSSDSEFHNLAAATRKSPTPSA